jgi:hypothetical protein
MTSPLRTEGERKENRALPAGQTDIRDKNKECLIFGRENSNGNYGQCTRCKKVKLKQSRNRPGVAQRVPGGLGSQIS